MLGNAMMRTLSESGELEVLGTIRSEEFRRWFPPAIAERLLRMRDVTDSDALRTLLLEIRPQVVVNCISPARGALRKGDALALIPICALLPHQLVDFCGELEARLVHISTDGVFSGRRGAYTEDDVPDPTDVYGLAKLLGEPRAPRAITLRTSMIGHELRGCDGLVEWFLSQRQRCNCFARAVFSGLPTVVLSQVVRDFVLPHPELSGVYHVAGEPISKCELLRLIARTYDNRIEIKEDEGAAIDRSLNAEKFRRATGYVAPDWPTLIQTMYAQR